MDPRVREDDGWPSFPATENCHSRLRPGIQEVMDPRVREDDGCLLSLILWLIK